MSDTEATHRWAGYYWPIPGRVTRRKRTEYDSPEDEHAETDRSVKVGLVAKSGSLHTGTDRYAESLRHGLRRHGVSVELTPVSSAFLWRPLRQGLRRVGVDVEAFFSSYPLRLDADPSVDLFHLTTQTMATLLVGQRIRRPVVVTVLDVIPYLVRRDPELNTFGGPIDELFYRLALVGARRADAVVAISEYTRDTLVRHLGFPLEKVHVVHLGVDSERFRPRTVPPDVRVRLELPEDAEYVLYVGSNDPRKNLRTLLRAFARVRPLRPRAILLLAGHFPFARQTGLLKALATELALGPSVRFLGTVSDDDLPLLYNLADVFVLPARYEGFGFPALEAMACGTPVVCANSTALPEVVGDAGVLVDAMDADALGQAILDLLDDEDRRRRLGEQGRNRAEQFTWSETVEHTCRVYESVRAS